VSTKPPGAPPPASPLFDFVEEAADEAEFEEIATMPTEERRAELKKGGVDLARLATKIERARAEAYAQVARGASAGAGPASATPGPGKVVSLADGKRRRTSPAWWLLLPAAAAVAIAIWKKDDVVAYFKPAPAPTPTQSSPVPPVPTAPELPPEQVQANALRRQAYDDCAKGYFHFCEDELDEAARLDSAGNKTLEVNTARSAIARAEAGWVDGGAVYVKPPVGPGEVPLKRTPQR
jgi:hypothetical protein